MENKNPNMEENKQDAFNPVVGGSRIPAKITEHDLTTNPPLQNVRRSAVLPDVKLYTPEQVKKILHDWEEYRHTRYGEATHNYDLHEWLNIPKPETKLPETSEGCKQWLSDVHEGRIPEYRYERASKLEKLLRYSTGGTNHKYLIDDFIEDLLDPGRKEREAKMKEIKADPNYEKYSADIRKDFKEGSQSFISLFLLHKMLEETPKEELQKYADEVTASGVGSDSPTVDEYFESLNPALQFQKGYSQGAKTLMEKLENRLAEDERPVIPVSDIVKIVKDIFDNE